MESDNQRNRLSEEDRIAAEKLHQRLRRLSEIPNMEQMAVSMFEFFAHLPTPNLTSLEETFLSAIEQQYGIE